LPHHLIDAVLHAVDRLRLRPALRHGEIEGAVVERENADELLGRGEDLVLVNGDSSKQIADIDKVELVFKDGVAYDSAKADRVRSRDGRAALDQEAFDARRARGAH